MNCGGDHASDDGRGNGFHHVGANAGFRQDGDEAREHDTHSHQLRTQAVDRAFDGCFFDVLML